MHSIRLTRTLRRAVAAMAGISLGGIVLAGGCSTAALNAVAAGVNAAAQSLNDTQGDLNLGEWLLSELDDL